MFSNNINNPEAQPFLAMEDARDDQKEEGPSSCVPDIKLEPISIISSSYSSPKKDREEAPKLGRRDDGSVDEQFLLQEEDQERVALLIKIAGATIRRTLSHCNGIIDILVKPSSGEGSSGVDKKEEEEEDGFRTPELKIPPECKICPPAPRKRKQSERNKRKASSSNTNDSHRILVIDELDDIELLFTGVKRSRTDPE